MKKNFLTLLFLVGVLPMIYSQNFVETFNGDIIKIGDIIKAGHQPSIGLGHLFFREIVNRDGRQEYVNVKDLPSFTDLQVKEIIEAKDNTPFASKKPIVRAYDSAQNKEYLIDIDNAISRGEIVSRYVDHSKDEAVFLSNDLLFACCIRVNQLPVDDKTVLLFIKTMDFDLYQKCIKDEFEFYAVKDKYKGILEEKINNFDFGAIYYIKNGLEIGKYDFEKKAYPLVYIRNKERNFLQYENYELIVTNPKFGESLSVEMSEAQKCNKLRRGLDDHGYINSWVYARIYFNILDQKMDLTTDKVRFLNLESLYRHKVIGIELAKIEVYNYNHCDYNLIGIVQ